MKNMFAVEWKRMTRDVRFWIALGLGGGLALWHLVSYVIPAAQMMEEITLEKWKDYPYSVFNSAIFNCHITLPFELYYTLFPILAVLPFADSYFWDKNSGYLKNIGVRAEKKHYYAAKYTVVFLSGFLVVVFPLVVSLWSTAMFLPDLPPEIVTATFPMNNRTLWNELYVSNPYVFSLFMFGITGMFGGIMAAICLCVSDWLDKRFLILLFPFLLYLFFRYVLEYLELYRYSPATYLRTGYVADGSTGIVLGEIFVLLAVTLGIFYIRGKKSEIL